MSLNVYIFGSMAAVMWQSQNVMTPFSIYLLQFLYSCGILILLLILLFFMQSSQSYSDSRHVLDIPEHLCYGFRWILVIFFSF